MLVITLVDDDGITLGLDDVKELWVLDGSCDGSNDVKIEGTFPGESLRTDDGTDLGSLDGDCYGNNYAQP